MSNQGSIYGLVRMRRTKRAEVDRDGEHENTLHRSDLPRNHVQSSKINALGTRTATAYARDPRTVLICTSVSTAGTKKMDEINQIVKEKRALLNVQIEALSQIVRVDTLNQCFPCLSVTPCYRHKNTNSQSELAETLGFQFTPA